MAGRPKLQGITLGVTRVSEETAYFLEMLAKERGVSKGVLIQEALDDFRAKVAVELRVAKRVEEETAALEAEMEVKRAEIRARVEAEVRAESPDDDE